MIENQADYNRVAAAVRTRQRRRFVAYLRRQRSYAKGIEPRGRDMEVTRTLGTCFGVFACDIITARESAVLCRWVMRWGK